MAKESSSIIPVLVHVQVRLPQILEEEVQLRLPVKSLVRFKSVCKQWCSRFESRPFISLYHQRHPRRIYNKFSSELRTSSFQELSKMVPGLDRKPDRNRIGHGFWQRNIDIFGPLSNGIYCLTSEHMRLDNGCFSVMSAKIALCNPATGQYKFAEPFPREFHHMLYQTSSSPSDPPCRLYYGFGSVYKTNSSSEPSLDYRVVLIIHYGSKMPYAFLVLVYSFQRHKWRKIVDYRAGRRKVGKPKATDAFDLQGSRITDIGDPIEDCPQGFFKGCFHWAVAHQDISFSVLAFNFSNQSFKVIGGPPNHMDYVVDQGVNGGVSLVHQGSPLVLHDHLAFITRFNVLSSQTSDPRTMQTVEIGVWMMMEYGVEGSWTRIYKINPEFNGHLNRLDGIDYEEDPCAEGGIHIKRLILKVGNSDSIQEIISCDNVGHQVISSAKAYVPLSRDKRADDIVTVIDADGADDNIFCWSTPGISTYIETLERL